MMPQRARAQTALAKRASQASSVASIVAPRTQIEHSEMATKSPEQRVANVDPSSQRQIAALGGKRVAQRVFCP